MRSQTSKKVITRNYPLVSLLKCPSCGSGVVPARNMRSKVIIIESEAITVKKIFQLYASGRGLKSIANELNHSG